MLSLFFDLQKAAKTNNRQKARNWPKVAALIGNNNQHEINRKYGLFGLLLAADWRSFKSYESLRIT